MCSGSTADGSLHVTESEIQARCAADSECVGYSQWVVPGDQSFFRPVTSIAGVASDNQWKTFSKCPSQVGPSGFRQYITRSVTDSTNSYNK